MNDFFLTKKKLAHKNKLLSRIKSFKKTLVRSAEAREDNKAEELLSDGLENN